MEELTDKAGSPAEEEAGAEEVSEQPGGVLHLRQDGLAAGRTGYLHRLVPQAADCGNEDTGVKNGAGGFGCGGFAHRLTNWHLGV